MTPRNKVLEIIDLYNPHDIREVAEKSGFSFHDTFCIVESLEEKGLIKDLSLTNKGVRTLSAYDKDDPIIEDILRGGAIGIGYVAIVICLSFIVTCLLG